MPSVLRGNYQAKTDVSAVEKETESLSDRFESAALKRLGGSVAFVSKKKVSWDIKE